MMRKTEKIMFLPRVKSEVKRELHQAGIDIINQSHDHDMAVYTVSLPKQCDFIEFMHGLRHKYKDVK